MKGIMPASRSAQVTAVLFLGGAKKIRQVNGKSGIDGIFSIAGLPGYAWG
jgi:hypothetical protein